MIKEALNRLGKELKKLKNFDNAETKLVNDKILSNYPEFVPGLFMYYTGLKATSPDNKKILINKARKFLTKPLNEYIYYPEDRLVHMSDLFKANHKAYRNIAKHIAKDIKNEKIFYLKDPNLKVVDTQNKNPYLKNITRYDPRNFHYPHNTLVHLNALYVTGKYINNKKNKAFTNFIEKKIKPHVPEETGLFIPNLKADEKKRAKIFENYINWLRNDKIYQSLRKERRKVLRNPYLTWGEKSKLLNDLDFRMFKLYNNIKINLN